jgi:hypothetical protein
MIELIIPALTLFVSLAVLATASFFAIKYIEDFMEITRLSEVSAGFVILAIMTCMPELTVAIFAIQHGTAGISIGDILGSHIFNIGIVVGLLAAFGSLKNCSTVSLVELIDLLFIASLIPLLLVAFKVASPIVGLLLIGVFVVSFYKMSRKRRPPTSDDIEEKRSMRRHRTFAILAVILVATVIVVLMARFTIISASEIVKLAGVSQPEIGAKIVAVGTSRTRFWLGSNEKGKSSPRLRRCHRRKSHNGNFGPRVSINCLTIYDRADNFRSNFSFCSYNKLDPLEIPFKRWSNSTGRNSPYNNVCVVPSNPIVKASQNPA